MHITNSPLLGHVQTAGAEPAPGQRGLQGLGWLAGWLCHWRRLHLLWQVGELLLQGQLGLLGELVQVGLWCLEWVQWGWRAGLLHQAPLLELQELLGLQVQDGVWGWGWLQGHLHLAEQHHAQGALLALVHLLLQRLHRHQEGLQDLEAEIRQGRVNSCCPPLTGPSESRAAHPTCCGLTLNSRRFQTHPRSPHVHTHCQLTEVNILILETSSPKLETE